MRSLLLRAGSANSAKIALKAGSGRLRLTTRQPLTLPISIRLQSTTGQCWESEFDTAGALVNTETRFKGTGQ